MEPSRKRIEDFMRRYGLVLAVAVVLVAVSVTSAGLLQTPTYEASAILLVAQGQSDGRPRPIPKRVASPQELNQMMALVIDTRPVAEEVIQHLELEMAPAVVLDNLSVEHEEGTQFIQLSYTDTDPERAQAVVNTVGKVSSEQRVKVGSTGIDLTATVGAKAAMPESPVSPHPWRNGLLTLAIGLGLCAGTVVVRPGVGARVAGTLGERPSRQGIGQARVLSRRHSDYSIVERVKEKKLLRALGRRGKLTAVEAALETGLSVDEANRILQELAFAGHLEVTVEHSRLLYSFWGEDEA